MALNKKAHIIVIGNEKGGTGKSTISMHLAVKFLQENYKIATIDLDGRQGTLSKYIANREKFNNQNNANLHIPEHYKLTPISFEDTDKIKKQIEELKDLVASLSVRFDAIIIDTAGSNNYLFAEGYKFADTLITPINESLIDLDIFADVDIDTVEIGKINHFSEFIWDIKKAIAMQKKPFLNWIVVKNRVSHINSKNKDLFNMLLLKLAKKIGFRTAGSIRERVIYRELFLQGLTVLDMRNDSVKLKMSLSHVAAKREIKALAEAISNK